MYFFCNYGNYMDLIATIKEPVKAEMQQFEACFASSLKTDNPLLSNITEYVLTGSGKKLRPILVLLAAKLCGQINDTTINGAVALELLHTASLIHDDVVDDTDERRGKESVQIKWNNKIAILSGDYMLSSSLRYGTRTKNLNILELISNIGCQLSDGELLQLLNVEQAGTTEEEYFNVIRKKTALLFSTCLETGAWSAQGNETQIKALRNYGEFLGICFQLKDDVFDYDENASIGKPTGNDIRDGKVTLPLIYALRNTEGAEKDQIFKWMQKKDFSQENIHRILDFARKNGGIRYAESQMEIYKNKAINELVAFPDSEIKQALITCAEFVVKRDK